MSKQLTSPLWPAEFTRVENAEQLWRPEVLGPGLLETLGGLHRASVLSGFYLAGGTGLALYLGHRRSVDLDFFSAEPFHEDALLQKVQALPRFSLIAKSKETLHGHVRETKISFLGYAYPVLFPLQEFGETSVADPRDIACMKISALAGRGTRRDFVDLYVAARRYGLKQLLALFRKKFAQANYSMMHVLKSLTYFEEAEKDPMPDMLVALSWEEVKQFFTQEAPRLVATEG